ncbi:MAG: DUF4256 domain-containing protein [Marinirhabdus sp.]|nr:DUF4256 domain-containing protein [Marinirhabdus sp.]
MRRELSTEKAEDLLTVLKSRFEDNSDRNKMFNWLDIEHVLRSRPEKLWSLNEMERTGGEPDVVAHDEKTGEFLFFDCVAESPKGRRSTCYDLEGLESRKAHKPAHNAIDMASEMGISLLTETEYLFLQQLGTFDQKTSSWLQTPNEVRALGGAIFGDFRFGRVFIYHNGAQSYYGSRGFRASLRV